MLHVFLSFLTISNAWLQYRAHSNTKTILIYNVVFVKGYNIYQYLFGIQLCSMLAKCGKLSNCRK